MPGDTAEKFISNKPEIKSTKTQQKTNRNFNYNYEVVLQ